MPGFTDQDLSGLARTIQSEAGSSASLAERIAVGWVCRNRARKRGVTIAAMTLPPAKQGKGRPMSSARAATPESTEAAHSVLSMADDPTNGATSAFEPALQDALFSRKRPGYTKDAGMVRASWLRDLDYYGSVGAWDLFGPKGGAGAKPVPMEWGLGTDLAKIRSAPIRGRGTSITSKLAASGGIPWLLLLLLGLAFKRR